MSANHKRLRELFEAVIDRPPEERRAILDEACGEDATLRSEIESLLQHHDITCAPLGDQAAGLGMDLARAARETANSAASNAPLPKSIGRYDIVKLLGSGGMGMVYLAEQRQPRRSVAIKVLRHGILSKQLQRRFEFETQVLGQLKHPGIAHIYEAGTTQSPEGRQSYFAMEFVDGLPLTQYTAGQALGTRASLDLLARICDAVQHAHHKGIVHRDLKPGNILVTADGAPKILDFGVARATDADVQTMTLQTDVGQLVGTIPYMSPEQVSGVSSDVDTRSDVYALGVIAFELLTGRLPHLVRERSIPEAARMIREEDPSRLSSINPIFSGDVETIVAKALDKDKQRRYQSAAELAADIRRYLKDEPILARPASAMYQLGKFARRNRALVGGAATTFVAVSIGFVVSVVLFVQADRARVAEAAQRTRAQLAADRANAINDFLLQDMLAAPNPYSPLGKDVTVASVLDGAVDRVDAAFENQPLTEAEVRTTLGRSFLARGLYDSAASQPDRAVGIYRTLASEDDRLFIALERHAEALRLAGRLEAAQATIDGALKIARERYGPAHAHTATALYTLAQVQRTAGVYGPTEETLQRCLDVSRALQPAQPGLVAKALIALGGTHYLNKAHDKAEPVFQEALGMLIDLHGADHPFVAQVQSELGAIDFDEKRYADAAAHLTPACDTMSQYLGDEHSETLMCRRTLALSTHGMGRSAAGIAALQSVIDIAGRALGPEHPETLMAVNSLAFIHMEQKNWAEAATLLERLLNSSHKTFGPAHAETLRYATNLAWAWRHVGRLDEAEVLFRDTAQRFEDEYGIDFTDSLVSRHSLALFLQSRQKWDDCFEAFRTITDACRQESIDCGWRGMYYLNGFGDALLEAEEYEQAIDILAEAVTLCEQAMQPADWRLADTRGKLGFAHAQLGNADQAEALLVMTYPIVLQSAQAPPGTKQLAYDRLQQGLARIGRAERAGEFSPPAAQPQP